MKKKPGRKVKQDKESLPRWVQRTRQLVESLTEPLSTDESSPIFRTPSFENLLNEGAAIKVDPPRTSRRLRGKNSTIAEPVTAQDACGSGGGEVKRGPDTTNIHDRQSSQHSGPSTMSSMQPPSPSVSTTSGSIVLSYSSRSASTAVRQDEGTSICCTECSSL